MNRIAVSSAAAGPVAVTHDIASSDTPGLRLHLRERRPPPSVAVRPKPLLLIHGATIASALWDAALPGWSWMDRLAEDGHRVFALDLRGYGGSTRPACFAGPAEDAPAYARASQVLADVSDAVDFVLAETGAAQTDLLGGSWGSVICGMFMVDHARDRVRRLILYAPLYAQTETRPDWLPPAAHPLDTDDLELQFGAYRWVSLEDLRCRWDAEIPSQETPSWRPEGMLETMVADYIDPSEPGIRFKVPNGTLVDLSCVFSGKSVFDCTRITAPTLLVRGDADPISTHADACRLLAGLGSATKRYEIIPNGAHFMVAERALPELHSVVTAFLQSNGPY